MTFEPFSAVAPASTANLGPGFDSVGVAVHLHNEVRVSPGSGNFSIEGEGKDALPVDHTNAVAAAFERAAPGLLDAVDLHCENRIPLARGLGSSTAAVACGLIAGWHASGQAWDAHKLFAQLSATDGHPDNAAPCALGAVTIAGPEDLVVHLAVPAWLDVVIYVPSRPLETSAARAALPDSYPKATVARALGSAAVLAASLATGDLDQFRRAILLDEIHEQQRSPLIPELARVREEIHSGPAYGATISGAGPSIAVWCHPDDTGLVSNELRALAERESARILPHQAQDRGLAGAPGASIRPA